jgi:hypothetical protein
MKTRHIVRLVASAALALIVSTSAITPQPAQADGFGHDLVIGNATRSNASFLVCQNWGSTGCAANSSRKYLAPGKNTKTAFGWADADGVFIGPHCSLTTGRAALSGGTSGKWVKLAGAFGLTVIYNYYC